MAVTGPEPARAEVVAALRSAGFAVRRSRADVEVSADSALAFGDVQINLAARTVTDRNHPVELTPREFELLVHLVRHPGMAFSRQELLHDVWGSPYRAVATVTEHVRRLRVKMPDLTTSIATLRGAGYRFDPPTR